MTGWQSAIYTGNDNDVLLEWHYDGDEDNIDGFIISYKYFGPGVSSREVRLRCIWTTLFKKL